jgi:DNA-binding MarR family transcriptional regulator
MESKDKLGVLLKKIHLSYDQRINEVVKNYDLTRTQCEVIVFLSKNDDHKVTQKEIECFFSISNPTVTGLLNRLESKEFVVRKTSTKDARFKFIELTDKARALENEIRLQLEENEDSILSSLNKEEEVLLMNLLKRIVENL